MYYPSIDLDNNGRSVIDQFLGYNHNHRINSGEWFDMENLTSDYFPLAAARKKRTLLKEETGKVRGLIFTDGQVCYLVDNLLCLPNGVEVDISDYVDDPMDDSLQTLLRFGAYILVYPAQVYVNVYDTNDKGTWGDRYDTQIGTEITFSTCNSNGDDYDNIYVGNTAPEEHEDGMYWLCTKKGSEGLNIWYDAKGMWEPVATCYIRITIPGAEFTKRFKEGDVIYMNSPIMDINNGSKIVSMADDYIVVIAFMDSMTKVRVSDASWRMFIERKVPQMNMICSDKNRLWGCYYGYTDNGQMVNEIYASKLGDFRNWYDYSGLSTDSYAVSVGVEGEWTGCVSYQGYPTFFKENCLFKIYGSFPSEYQLLSTDCKGVQRGSSRSVARIGQYLMYKSPQGVCIYDGSYPSDIANEFGREELYYDAVSGACGDKYYMACETVSGQKRMFVYDMAHGVWMKEDAPGFELFSASENGQIYAANGNQIWGLGSSDNMAFLEGEPGEEYTEWYAETGNLGLEYPDFKYVDKIMVRAFIPFRSEIQIAISENDKPFYDVCTMRSNSQLETQTMSFRPMRCDHFRLRFKGHGQVKIYSICIQMETDGDENGNAYI